MKKTEIEGSGRASQTAEEVVPQPERRKLIAAVSTLVGAAVGKAVSGRDVLAAQGDPVL